MSNGKSRVLIIALLALVAVLAVVTAVVLLGEDESIDSAAAERDESETSIASDSHESTASNDDGEADESRRKKIRRTKTEQQRQQLIKAIEMARALRQKKEREQRLYGDGTDGEDAEGTLSRETIQDAVAAVIEDVKHCYEDQLTRTPDLGGKMVVSFTIKAEEGAGGVVDLAEIGDDSDEAMRNSRELSECIVDTVYTLELPEPEGGGEVKISYPFLMNPGEKQDEKQ